MIEARKPHYFFFSKHNVVLNIDDRGERLENYRRYFENNYPVLAWSPYGSMVLDISWGAFGTSHLVKGRNLAISDLHTKLVITPEQIEVSGANSIEEGASNLVAEGTEGYWLTSPEENGAAWIRIDVTNPQPVSIVRIRPRAGHVNQLPYGNSTLLEGSDNGNDWESLAVLGIDKDAANYDWLTFPVHNTKAYKHYRISFRDPNFQSLSRLELYTIRNG